MAETKLFDFLFGDFTFEAAATYFGEKLPMTRNAFDALGLKYRRGAFTVTGYTQAQVIDQFYGSLHRAIEEGRTMAEFRNEMNDFLSTNGYEGLGAYQADNIYRTNVQTAYQVGHYEEMTDPDVMDARPYWMYEAVGDSRTRPAHMAMDGKVFMADNPIWDTWYPPNGYRCRCTVVTLSKRQVESMGLTVSSAAPTAVEVRGRDMPVAVDNGFDYNPAKQEFRPDMGSYPESIRKAYQERQKGQEK